MTVVLLSDNEQKNIVDREKLEETNRVTETSECKGVQRQEVDLKEVVPTQKQVVSGSKTQEFISERAIRILGREHS